MTVTKVHFAKNRKDQSKPVGWSDPSSVGFVTIDVATKRRVYATDHGDFVISENDMWLPGAYATEEAAWAAFDLTADQLAALQDRLRETQVATTIEEIRTLQEVNR